MSRIKLANGSRLKLIASDMDGTLLQSDQKIERRTLDILIRLQVEGVKLALISGRPLGAMLTYAKELGLENFGGAAIAVNGGHAFEVREKRELWRHTMPVEDAARYFNAWQQFGLDHIAYGEKKIYLDSPRRSEEVSEEDEALIQRLMSITGSDVELRDLTKPLEEEPTKVCVFGPREKILEGLKVVKPLVQETIYGTFSADNYYEGMIRGVNKGTGLQEYADMLGIMPEEILVFGDQDNDIPMFAYAGTGVAMKRASEGLAAQATYRTGSHNQGGIFEFLNKLLQNQQ